MLHQSPKHATQLAQEAKEQGIDIVAAVGGDGTMNECAQALVNSNSFSDDSLWVRKWFRIPFRHA